MKDSITHYENLFSADDYQKILSEVAKPKWQFGHGSHHSSDPRSKKGYPFWVMGLEDNLFFTDHLLNIIKEKTNQDYELYDVYANGHTFGTKGSFHTDWNDEHGRTFLFYANDTWDIDWGGKTLFNFGNGDYYCHIPKPNSALLFPGIIPHAAEGPTRSFIGLRITIAWKLLLK